MTVATARQERMEVHPALQYATTFHCQVVKWHGCDKLKPTPKEKGTLVRERERKKHQALWCAFCESDTCMRCAKKSEP